MIKLIKEFEGWELHHKIAAFNLIMIGTILVTRAGVFFYNPNPIVFNFEIHHFDYGIILLFITTLLLLFHPRKNYPLYLIMAAVAFGLVLDELLFVRANLDKAAEGNLDSYNVTLFGALILAKIITVITLFVGHSKNKKKASKAKA